ncbi:helix-turn-helix transcriptional regulator [Streptomyces sp. ACA25]|uniref:helix-turn-helix transcriptional regulator n=1 Tax=Streptomyces sp. ACA25 TaxID=3022596 RepID=UPI00230770BE|nr:helix-turn-helix transcriptional regulator [Streptomyces sp. ACA25]MDB1086063.1 helix-turn-helix transcriptional regulator [Streptomyces sp. ACA25]
MGTHVMSVLGLTATEEEIYRHFLRHPDTSPGDIHLLLRSDRHTTAQALARLRDLRLLQGDDQRAWATEPDTAVARLAEERLENLHREMRNLTSTRPILEALRQERAPQEAWGGPAPGIERLEDLRHVRSRIDDLSFFAHSEVMAAEPYTALSPENISYARPLDLRCLRRGVRIRNLVRRVALSDRDTVAYLRELTSHGARIRVADDFSELILIYDRSTAMVPVDPKDTSRGALCARESGLVENIITLFERLWDAAEDFSDLVDPADRPAAELTGAQREALHRMCTVNKDESGARTMGVSLRTYRRHIADVMQLLGAENRAQAALMARERGWV